MASIKIPINTNKSSAFNKASTMSIQTLIQNRSLYDTSPPYQRGLCWKRPMCVKFIRALVEGAHVSPITLIQKGGSGALLAQYYVLDGRQRVEGAIFGFIDGFFKIEIDGLKPLTYNEIVKYSKDPQAKSYNSCMAFLTKFHTADLVVNYYNPMILSDQVTLFSDINASVKFTAGEKLLTPNFLVSKLCKYYLSLVQKELDGFLKPTEQYDLGMKGCQLILNLLYTHFDIALRGSFLPKEVGGQIMAKKVHEMNDQLQKIHGWDANTVVDETALKGVLEDNHDHIVNSIKYLTMCLKAQSSKMKYTRGSIYDLLLFYLLQTRNGAFNYTYCATQATIMANAITSYVHDDRLGPDSLLKTRNMNIMSIKERLTMVTERFEKAGINLLKKDQRATERDKRNAIREASGVCQISGEVIGDNKIEFDHPISTKLTSDSKVQVSKEHMNRVKSSSATHGER